MLSRILNYEEELLSVNSTVIPFIMEIKRNKKLKEEMEKKFF